MKKFGQILLLCLLITSFSSVCAETHIKILHTNDTHARIVPINSKLHGQDLSGATRRAMLIKEFKTKAPEALVLDAGDMFQGTPFFNFFNGEACYKIAKACGYDATTLGNHELDSSLENLLEKLKVSDMRLLCCNVLYRKNDQPAFAPYHIFERQGKKIGVIGSIGDEAWETVDKKTKAPLYAKPQTEMVEKFAKQIRAEVDLVVVLSHSGFEFDLLMAAEIAEIDVILGGHTHEEVFSPILVKNTNTLGDNAYNNGLDGTIVAQAGEHGIFLGVLDITLGDNGQIATFSGKLEIVDKKYDSESQSEVAKLVEFYHAQLKSKMARVAGKSKYELSYPKDLKKTHLLPMGSFTAEAMRTIAKADVCMVNSGGIRAGIPAGNVTCGQVFEALPYDNTVVTFLMKGDAVNRMLSFICKNPEKLDGFQYAGISGTFNFKTGMAHEVMIDDQLIDEKKVYRICTSSFIANGNLGGDILFAKVEGIEDSGVFMRDAAISYLELVKDLPEFGKNKLVLIKK